MNLFPCVYNTYYSQENSSSRLFTQVLLCSIRPSKGIPFFCCTLTFFTPATEYEDPYLHKHSNTYMYVYITDSKQQNTLDTTICS